jgi:hypothetical protein
MNDGEPHLEALMQYYNAFKFYPRRALSYLRAARAFEVPLIPSSEASYDAEEGTLWKNSGLLRSALEKFDPVWERDMIADVYAELARPGLGEKIRRIAAGTGEDTQRPEERLYALNRGALRQRGIRLPVELVISAGSDDSGPGRIERSLRRALRRIGFEPQWTDSPRAEGLRFRLSITAAGDGVINTTGAAINATGAAINTTGAAINATGAACELYDRIRGASVFRRSIPLASLSAQDLSAFARALGDAAFTEE